ncbi:MAG: 1-acyl-sn-glycerol-3-phosphate acyltransferase [Deltaproteobacteria bacterium]|nr:1-acyl-sn-glycerol-3-phosphate acyltransferase [Deltaproteobacteria bacterium]
MAGNHSFHFNAFLRALFLIFSAAIYTAILGILAFASCLFDRSGRWPSFFQRTWGKWLLRTNGIHVNAVGLEHLGKDRAYILISNHASILDIPGIIAAIPLPVRFIAKRSLIWFPIFGWVLYLSGHILIDRESSLSALKSLKRAVALMENGTCVIVFAEGTRSPDGQVKEFKRGAFLLALQSKVPILPISISGTFQMLPRHGWCFWPATIEIHVDKPIPTQGIPLREIRPLIQRVRETIIQNLKQ